MYQFWKKKKSAFKILKSSRHTLTTKVDDDKSQHKSFKKKSGFQRHTYKNKTLEHDIFCLLTF